MNDRFRGLRTAAGDGGDERGHHATCHPMHGWPA